MLPKSQRVGINDFKDLAFKHPDSTLYFPQFLVKYYQKPLFKATVVISREALKTSTKRNLIKRRLRSLIETHKASMKTGFYVFILKKGIVWEDLSYEKLNSSFDSFLSKNN